MGYFRVGRKDITNVYFSEESKVPGYKKLVSLSSRLICKCSNEKDAKRIARSLNHYDSELEQLLKKQIKTKE